MDFYAQYEEKLEALLADENNIFLFCDLIKNEIRHKFSSCLEIIEGVVNFCIENHLDEAKAWMYYYLAWIYCDLSEFDKSIETFEEAKDIFEKYDNKKGMAYIYNGLTSFYCQNGYPEISNEFGMRGISIAKDIPEDDILLKLLVNISITNIINKSYEAAKEILNYIETTYNYSKTDFLCEILYIKSMTEIELNIGDPNNALKLIKRASEVDKENGISVFTTEIYKLLGAIYSKLGMIDEADAAFDYSIKTALEKKMKIEYCEALFEFAKHNFSIDKNKKAVENLILLIEAAKENNFNALIKNSSRLLYEYHKKQGNYEISLRYLEDYMKADKKLNNYKSKRLMAKLNVECKKNEMSLYKLIFDKSELLSKIGQRIISELDIESMVMYINNETRKLVKLDFLAVILYEEETDEIVHITVLDEKILKIGPKKLGDGTMLSEYCIRNKKVLFINDSRKDNKKFVKKTILVKGDLQAPLSIISIPLMINDKVIGVMSIQSMQENVYESNDVNTLKIIGNYAAIALKNSLEYKNMENKAIYDNLTGFLTKREIMIEANELREKFLKTKKSFCIFMIDIDDFKAVNDTYGHLIGDDVIKIVTNAIGRAIRPVDYIGRYGGDEFLLLCPNINKAGALNMAEKIRYSVENVSYLTEENKIIKSTISIGIYEFNKSSLSIVEGINFADQALYRAKYDNKNNVKVF